MRGRRERVAAVVVNPAGRLIVVADHDEVTRGLIHGWETLFLMLAGTGSTLSMAGRLTLQIDGFNQDSRALFQIPEAARWMVHLQRAFPWLAAWLDPNTAFQLVGALAPWKVVRGGRPRRGKEQVKALVHVANYAVAYTHKLGGKDLGHVHAFLGALGLNDIPDGFFDGAERLADELDGSGRVMGYLGYLD